ncbi:MAG: hypothetical protein GWN99_06060 [Gemmatimonadetes bacterium]|uniref:RDD domain-containing protein n=1 Tax=Candidatus Kutchimonas denitrificans TaxID=3056748 RepID=A0AAE5CBQ7_9BACT|nr:hypothetical protein [Gemmatimonadota bacterium]NIR76187.1 hypothetical protein [Candidatus Kutchimonas denitrificans]NIS00627.1 hypothetical protein [Gemmatimonadota bacterium]NIT66772.1 hypothetical protein [Gemmatimonadota bacterium]NIV23371.1 hypothetical protein [Gemmatimonadota bacterium]
MPDRQYDPKEIITPDAFSVADELLGTPLARPWRRGVAMGVDLSIIGIVTSLGLSWLLLFLAVTVLAVRAALRPAADRLRKGGRWAIFGSLAVLAGIATLIAAVQFYSGFGAIPGLTEMARDRAASEVANPEIFEAVQVGADAAAIESASTPEELRSRSESLVARLERLGVSRSKIEETIEAIAAEREEEWAREALLSALDREADEVRADPDSLALAYAAALQANDSARIAELREPLTAGLAADRIDRLQRRNERLEEDNRELRNELEAEEERGLLNLILRVANEVGIDIGWSALYFTLFPLFWGGRTPGKRLMGIRIVRLDAEPLGWWPALNRFGGYAASVFTGLLGFLEMFWDENRQAMQDRIASTVVVRESGPGRNWEGGGT